MPRGLKIKKQSFLTEAECRIVHEGSCRLLEETGVELTNPKALNLFKEGGAIQKGNRIKMSRDMINRAVEKTAKNFIMKAKDPENELILDTKSPRVHFGTGGQALYVLRKENGMFKKKEAVTQDLVDILRICEKLDHVDFITRPVEPDVPDEEMDLEKTRLFLAHTTKHMNLANLIIEDCLPDIIEKVGDRSSISFISCVAVSPLNLVSPTVEKFIRIVSEDIPVAISSCPQAGLTAPLSEVGEIIQVNAEILSAVVLANLVRPGAKVLYRGIPITSNLHLDVSPRWCQPESIRRIALISDITYFYGIPCCGTAAVSDEKKPTSQALSEKVLGWIFEAASGAQFINSALGMLEQVMTVSPEQYIIDDMGISLVKKYLSMHPGADLKETGREVVFKALETFDVKTTREMEKEIANRIEFIYSPKEEYSPDYINNQVDHIVNAVSSAKSSSKFLKDSRKGLRKGWLYMGKRIEGAMNLKEVLKTKDGILGMRLRGT
ncbi:MAG: trimethylamine methyltransferase family protein [Candidatus Aminicenantes bacterium]|nr:trimethylamine methyltransferase family protein [Candidatus Aminicenantes bacterium]